MSDIGCARGTDGLLKDASDIDFYHDPNDSVPLLRVSASGNPPQNAFSHLLSAGKAPTVKIAGTRHTSRISKPSGKLRDVDNISASTSRKRTSLHVSCQCSSAFS